MLVDNIFLIQLIIMNIFGRRVTYLFHEMYG